MSPCEAGRVRLISPPHLLLGQDGSGIRVAADSFRNIFVGQVFKVVPVGAVCGDAGSFRTWWCHLVQNITFLFLVRALLRLIASEFEVNVLLQVDG